MGWTGGYLLQPDEPWIDQPLFALADDTGDALMAGMKPRVFAGLAVQALVVGMLSSRLLLAQEVSPVKALPPDPQKRSSEVDTCSGG